MLGVGGQILLCRVQSRTTAGRHGAALGTRPLSATSVSASCPKHPTSPLSGQGAPPASSEALTLSGAFLRHFREGETEAQRKKKITQGCLKSCIESLILQRWDQRDCPLLPAAIPRMELPPLSPGIQASVMDDAEVLETVSRGWSGGTGEEEKAREHLACIICQDGACPCRAPAPWHRGRTT